MKLYMQPRPIKPAISIVQVGGSGAGGTSVTLEVRVIVAKSLVV
jgi:hypothetical protein